MKALKFLLAPLLLLAIITTSLYVGIARPGAVGSMTAKFISKESVRQELARQLVDQLVKSDNTMVKALLTTDRPKAEAAIAKSLSEEQEQRDISAAAERISTALFTGKSEVTLDPKPIYRPIYQGIDAVFPILKLEESQLGNLDPIEIGKDQPLPNLGPVRTGLMLLLLLWPLWLALAFLYGRRKPRTVAIQTLVVAGASLLFTLIIPVIFSAVVSNPLQRTLIGVVLTHLASAAMWISLILVIASTAVLLLIRKRIVAGQNPTQSE